MSFKSEKCYHDLINILSREDFGYGEALRSVENPFAWKDILRSSTILDKKGKPFLPQGDSSEIEDIYEMLKNGDPIYVFKKGSTSPVKISYDQKSGEMTVSDEPLNKVKPQKPKKPTWREWYFNLIMRMYGKEHPAYKAKREYKELVAAQKNAASGKVMQKRVINDSKLIDQPYKVDNLLKKNNRGEIFNRLCTTLAAKFGYQQEFDRYGKAQIYYMMQQGLIRGENGEPFSISEGAIAERLIDGEHLYIFPKDSPQPLEVFFNHKSGALEAANLPLVQNVSAPQTAEQKPAEEEKEFSAEEQATLAQQKKEQADKEHDEKDRIEKENKAKEAEPSPIAPKAKSEQLIEKLQALKGNHPVSEIAKKNIEQMCKNAAAAEQMLGDHKNSKECFEGKDAVRDIIALNSLERQIERKALNHAMSTALEDNNCVMFMRKMTEFVSQVNNAAQNGHEYKFFKDNFLDKTKRNEMSDQLELACNGIVAKMNQMGISLQAALQNVNGIKKQQNLQINTQKNLSHDLTKVKKPLNLQPQTTDNFMLKKAQKTGGMKLT